MYQTNFAQVKISFSSCCKSWKRYIFSCKIYGYPFFKKTSFFSISVLFAKIIKNTAVAFLQRRESIWCATQGLRFNKCSYYE